MPARPREEDDTFLTLKYGKVKYRIEITGDINPTYYVQIMLDLIKIWDNHGIAWDEKRNFWGYKNEAWLKALEEIKQYRAEFIHTHFHNPFIIIDPSK